MRGRYQRHPFWWDAGEDALLVRIVSHAVRFGDRLGISVQLRAGKRVRAMSFPLRALHICEVSAMARERPTVMQGPSDLATVRRKPTEQHFDIHPIAMDVMQVDNIRINFVQELQKFGGIVLGVETHAVAQASHGTMEIYLGFASTAPHMFVNTLMSPAPETVGIDPMRTKLRMQTAHNGAGRPVVEAVQLDIAKGPVHALRYFQRLIDE